MKTGSIHFRLIRWYGGVTILVSAAFGAYVYYGTYRSLYEGFDRVFLRRAENISNNVLSNRKNRDDAAREIGALYSPESNGWFIRITQKDGNIFFLSGPPKDKRFDPYGVPRGKGEPVRTEKLYMERAMRIVSVPTPDRAYEVEMGMPTDGVEDVLDGLIKMLLIGVPAITLLVSAGGYVLVRRALQPVEAIRATAEQITFGNLSNRLPVSRSGDELEHLSVTLNQMLGRLDEAYQQAQRFSADASHELRTPLTILKGELESIIQEPGLEQGIKDRLGSLYEETERLARISESLSTLSRLDAGEAKMKFVTLDLAALACGTADQMSLLADEKKIAMFVDAGQPVFVSGDPGRLKQIIVNLLDNAIKYTPQKGTVSVTVKQIGGKAVLEAGDNGIGIPADSLPYVFDRFYRADKVRSREYGGAGLGLSIAKSICQAHGGEIYMESPDGKGTICRVELPLAKNGDYQ